MDWTSFEIKSNILHWLFIHFQGTPLNTPQLDNQYMWTTKCDEYCLYRQLPILRHHYGILTRNKLTSCLFPWYASGRTEYFEDGRGRDVDCWPFSIDTLEEYLLQNAVVWRPVHTLATKNAPTHQQCQSLLSIFATDLKLSKTTTNAVYPWNSRYLHLAGRFKKASMLLFLVFKCQCLHICWK